jgi:hypothetical protein
LKKRLERRIEKTISISTSGIVLNWGGWGNGKTHAAEYFCREDMLRIISDRVGKKPPFHIKITFPRGDSPIKDIFTAFVDQIEIESIRTHFDNDKENIERWVFKIYPNMNISCIVTDLIVGKSNPTLLKGYLYGILTDIEFIEIKKFGVLRNIDSEHDRLTFLAVFFAVLSDRQKDFSNTIVWIDGFESITFLNSLDIEIMSAFFRKLLDYMPSNLHFFINVSPTAVFQNPKCLKFYFFKTLSSEIRDTIYFQDPGKSDLKLDLAELLRPKNYRHGKSKSTYFPFTEKVVDCFISQPGKCSLKTYIESFSILLETAEIFEKEKIDSDFVWENIEEIVAWRSI